MPAPVEPRDPPRDWSEDVSARIREARAARGLTLRELAARIEVSASLISQIEHGKVRPSVNTLYALARELHVSLDDLLHVGHADTEEVVQVQRRGARPVLDLNDGVRWERLAGSPDGGVDFVEILYQPGGASSPAGGLYEHTGHEWGCVMAGTLAVEFADQTVVLEVGDAISFDSALPHRLHNPGEVVARAVWVILGRRSEGTVGHGAQVSVPPTA